MSTYCEPYGELRFATKETAEKAIALLVKGGWLEQEGNTFFWLDEMDQRVDKDTSFFEMGDLIMFNAGTMRNIGRALDTILETYKDDLLPSSYLRVTCFDGCFCLEELRDNVLVQLSPEEFKEVIGCSEDEIVYDDSEYEGDGEREDENHYISCEEAANEWLLKAEVYQKREE